MVYRNCLATLLTCVVLAACGGPGGTPEMAALEEPIRFPAEFEPTAMVLQGWSFGEVDAFHLAMAEATLFAGATPAVLVRDESEAQSISGYLRENGIDPDFVTFITAPFDSLWLRDYAPQLITAGPAETPVLVDFGYSYPDQLGDDGAPKWIARALGFPRHDAADPGQGLVIDGGDLLTDGFGTSFCTANLLECNGIEASELSIRLGKYLGIHRNITFEALPGGANNHIDMVLKVLDEETILLGEYKAPGPARDALESYLEVFDSLSSCYGRPYRIFRIPMPGPGSEGDFRTYLNALIVNNHILVPAYGIPEDFEAVDAYAAAAPGYVIQALDCSGLIQQRGAIHCVTREYPRSPGIRIAHPRIMETVFAGGGIQFQARCFTSISLESVLLHVRRPGEVIYKRYRMSLEDGIYSKTLLMDRAGQWHYRISAHGGGISGHKPVNGYAGGYLTLDVLEAAAK